jgi:hypothetical protein
VNRSDIKRIIDGETMFTGIAVYSRSRFSCLKACYYDLEYPKITLSSDVIVGLALLIIGCLAVAGIIPCNTILAGFLIGLGCIDLILTPIVFCCGGIKMISRAFRDVAQDSVS